VRELPFELIATCPNCEEFAFHKGPGTSSEAFARPMMKPAAIEPHGETITPPPLDNQVERRMLLLIVRRKPIS
jgi:hypothetical protein